MGLGAKVFSLTAAKNFLTAAFSRATYASMLETAQLRLMYIQEAIGNAITATRTALKNSSMLATIKSMAVESLAMAKEKIATGIRYAGAIAMGVKAAATGLLTTAMTGLGIATTFALGPMGKIIAALLALGVALFVSLHSPPLYIGLALLAVLMVGLGFVLTKLNPILTITGLAMIKFGAGVALAAVGIIPAAIGLAIMGISLAIVAAALLIAAPGMAIFAISLAAMNLALLAFAATSFITLPMLASIGAALLLAGVGAVALAVAFGLMNPTALSQVATELERIVAAVSMLDSFKMTQLGFAMSLMSDSAGATAPLRAAADLATATAAVTPEAAESTEKMMNAVVNVIQAADAGAGLKFGDQITEILDSVKGIVAAGQGGEGGQKEVKLYMDRNGRKEFAKGIIDDLSPELNKRLSISKGPQISG